jgi:Mrp family chromosome partitioning ATPase
MIAELIKTQTTAKGLQQQASQLQSQVNKLTSELSSISKNQAQLTDLQRKYEIAEGIYKGIIAQFQESKTSPFNTYPNVQTINESTVDPKPSEPKLWLIALGGILASIFGSIALVSFLESRKPLLGAKDLQQMEFPVLGRISRLKRPNMERYLEAEIDVDFQRLAAAVSCLMLENNRLMVTSATFGEGKTTVTLGLALALVNFGFRVLVVDGDLRQAEMSRRLKRPQLEVKGNSKLVSVYPGLDLLPAPHIPKNKIGEFFARGSFERYLSAIQGSGNYDYVLVDSAPVGLATETSLMSEVVHNVLFVVRPGTSDRYSVMDGFEQFTQHNARIRGLVVNGVESRTEGYRYRCQPELLEAEA